MERIIAVICTLAERGLPFRGNNEQFGSPDNSNYLGLLELVAKFDPFLLAHINRYGNSGSGNPFYLLKTVCEEMIQLMAKKVKDAILSDVKKAGYFSLSVDSTSDISHTDQLTLIIRYVSPEEGLPSERFLTFLELKDHSGESMADLVFNYLTTELEIDFRKCRGQSYDNAANMSDTRWKAHAKATEAILESYRAITDALSHLYSDVIEKGDTRLQANYLMQKMEELEFVFMLHFWTRVIRHFHKVSKAIKKSELLLSTCECLYSSLQNFLSKVREDFDELEQQAKAILPNVNYRTVTRRQRVRKRQGNNGNAPGPDALDEIS
ncbi:uncharacterized protein LOC106477819 [Limulus polyphemus]|uniref:Uncharacterized protein LOC106477819 n=1 Tax=Limulus polyphemus TaxID=6850 RepID=A0ABM1C439_LIMPO|nr:uncharacterized protein LOC106477819 [Limulus polyphemus]